MVEFPSINRRYFSNDPDDNNALSFTLSYLTKTCGLSPKSALAASKTVLLKSSEQPDSVLSTFLDYGFSKSNISEMIKKFPKMLHCNPDKTISPKIDFIRSLGVSTPNLVKIFTANPWILRQSLENQLVCYFNCLIQSKDRAIQVIQRNPNVLSSTVAARMIPNIDTLKLHGVPTSLILWLICSNWYLIGTNPVKFHKSVEKVKHMGFSPLSSHFVVAIKVLTVVTQSKWDARIEVFKRWGWSDEDITMAFKKSPWCLSISEDKLMDVLDFYVNKLGLDVSVILNRPLLLTFSLKKRLVPRAAVIQYLCSKGLVKVDSRITRLLECTNKYFFEKYVNSFKEEAPHLVKLYNEKLNEVNQ